MTSMLFWDITQRRMAILYESFEATYRSHFQGSGNPIFLGPRRRDR